jgi:O-antigen ligase
LALVKAALAFGSYKIYAIRDLAIFGYSMFLPLTYFSLKSLSDAAKLLRIFVYAGIALALLSLCVLVTGLDFGFLAIGKRFALGHVVKAVGGGEQGGICAETAAALLLYNVAEKKGNVLYLVGAMVCLGGLAAATTRSAVVGLALALTFMFVLGKTQAKLRLLRAGLVLGAIALIGLLMSGTGRHANLVGRFAMAVTSAEEGAQTDPDTAFRYLRWFYTVRVWAAHPLFGAGFGSMLLPARLDLDQTRQGRFNGGMPHNTFLFVLARVGVVGLSLILICWFSSVARLVRRAPDQFRPDRLAAAAILITMAGFAFFVLFFERPMNNAEFWIVCALALKLSPATGAVCLRRNHQSGSVVGAGPVRA